MKARKIIGILIVIILAIVFVVPLFMTDTLSVTSSVIINSDEETVFQQVNNLHNWSAWSPFENDSTIVNTYSGPESGVGAKREWKGEKSGVGSMTIVESNNYSHIKNKLEFESESGGYGNWEFSKNDTAVFVDWTITISDLSYPFERLISVIIKSSIQPMMDKGLESLKNLVEKKSVVKKGVSSSESYDSADSSAYSPSSTSSSQEVKIVDVAAITTLAIYDSSKIDGIGDLLQKNYGTLMKYVGEKGYAIMGAPLAVYHNWNPDGYIYISAAIPLHGKVKEHKNIKKLNIEAGKAVYAKHFGGYNTSATHHAIDDFVKKHNLQLKDFIWEEYITDPSTEPDTTKWQTDIYYPLK